MSDRIQLRIVVVGAGIAGLATAHFLARNGHSVHVIESSQKLSELGAGIQIPPNAGRLLYSHGLGEHVERLATENTTMNLRRYEDGSIIGKPRQNMKENYGYANMTIHRADLQHLLYDSAKQSGVSFTFGTKIEYNDVRNQGTSSIKELAEADLVIAADGISSRLRSGLFPEPHLRPKLTSDTCTRVVIPRAKLDSDSRLSWLIESSTNNVWLGPHRYVVGYPVRSDELYNVVLVQPGTAPVGVYNEPCSIDSVRGDFSRFDAVVRGLLEKADSAHRWMVSELPPLPSWIGLDGRLVLVGDAAHAMPPHAAQGASQSLEDGVVLATCLSALGAKSELKDMLALYEHLRRTRCERVVEVARANGSFFSLEDGPEQQARDARLAQQLAADSGVGESRPSVAGQQRPKADSQAGVRTPEFGEWLYNHDVVAEAKESTKAYRLKKDGLRTQL